MIKVILLGAEGCAESKDLPYVRDPTDAERTAWWDANPNGNDIQTDHSGRPYWLKAIDLGHPQCPERVIDRILRHVRVVHLEY